MDHQAIETGDVVERYVAGKLPPGDVARFEEHYLDCPACIGRIEDAERLHRGLRRVVTEEAARAQALRLGALATFLRLARSRGGAVVLTGLLLAALVPAGVELGQIRRLRQELDSALAALPPAERGAAPAAAAPTPAAPEFPEIPEDTGTQTIVDRLEAAVETRGRELAAERAARSELERRLAAERAPQADMAVHALGTLRGETAPAFTLGLPHAPRWFALWLEPGLDGFVSFRARLSRTQGGGVVWEGDGLEVNALGAVLVSFPPGFLSPGDYELDLEGRPAAGEPVPVARYRLHLTAE
jgi:hypothetical protein